MKLKRLKVLLPALTGMLLTNGTISPISNNNVETVNRAINVDSIFKKNKQSTYSDDNKGNKCFITEDGLKFYMYYKFETDLEHLFIKFINIDDSIPYTYTYDEETNLRVQGTKLYNVEISYIDFLNVYNGRIDLIYLDGIYPLNGENPWIFSFTLEDIPKEIKNSIEGYKDFVLQELSDISALNSEEYYKGYTSYIENLSEYRIFYIDEKTNLREAIKKQVDLYKENIFSKSSRYEITDIAYAYLYKTSDNESLPYSLFLKFLVNDKRSFNHPFIVNFNLYNVVFQKQFKVKCNDVEIKEEEEIDFGYGKTINDVVNLFKPEVILDASLSMCVIHIDKFNYVFRPGIIDEDLNRKLLDVFNIKEGKSLVKFYVGLSNNPVISFYINWIDDIQPEVTGEVVKFRTSNKDNFKFKELFKANDEKDGDVSESIELIEEEGKYFIKAKDAAGNESKKEILLDIDPILYENINVINDEKIQVPENILLTKKRFEKILTKIHGVEPQDVDIIPYVNNCKTKGIYKVSYKINEETKEMDFEVVDPIKKNPEPGDVADQINEAKDSFIAKVKTFFNKLGNWFRGVFTKWKFDCFITNEQWDTRFN